MNSDKKSFESNYSKLKDNIDKRADVVSYYMMISNPVGRRFCSLLIVVKLLGHLVMPMQVLLHLQETSEEEAADNPSEETIEHRVNYICLLFESAYAEMINLIVLGVVLVISFLFLIFFFCVDISESHLGKKQHPIAAIITAMLLLVGNMVFSPILSVFTRGILCYIQEDSCNLTYTPMLSLVVNAVGIIILLLLQELHFSLNQIFLPLKKVPWAKPADRIDLLRKSIFILQGLVVGLQHILLDYVSFLLVLLAIYLPLSTYLLMKGIHVNAFDPLIDFMETFKVTTVWTCTLFAIILLGLDYQKSSYIYLSLSFVSGAFLTFSIIQLKNYFYRSNFLSQEPTNFQQVLSQIMYLKRQLGSSDEFSQYMVIHYMLHHKESCTLEQCRSQSIHQGIFQAPTQDQQNYMRVWSEEIFENLFAKNDQHQLKNPQLRALEVFIQMDTFGIYFSSLFRLLTKQKDFKNRVQRRVYFALNMMLSDRIHQNEKHSGYINFNIDRHLALEANFLQYQDLMLNQTFLVEKFWTRFTMKDFDIRELLKIGFDIVDKYIQLKSLFLRIISENPSFVEVLALNVHFFQEVMNFEVEAKESMDQLRQVQQKLKLERQRLYYKYSESDMGMVLVKCNKEQNFTITSSNKIINHLLKYNSSQLKGKNIKVVIPRLFHKVHDSFVNRYLSDRSNRNESETMRHIWILNAHNRIVPVLINVKSFVSKAHGLFIGAFFQPLEKLVNFSYNSKSNKEIMMLANEEGYISAISRNADRKFRRIEALIDEDVYFNILDIFPLLTPDDLQCFPQEGIETKLLLNFSLLDQIDPIYQKGTLYVSRFFPQGQILIKELIFKESREDFIEVTSESEINELALQQDHQIQEALELEKYDVGKSMSSKSASVIMSNLEVTKQHLDFNQVPQAILNMKRAFVIFFLILIATSFSILIVSLVSWSQFDEWTLTIRASSELTLEISKFRLAIQMFIMSLSSKYVPYFSPSIDYQIYHFETDKYYAKIKDYMQQMQTDKISQEQEVAEAKDKLQYDLIAIDQNGEQTYEQAGFSIGMMQYLTKSEGLLNYDEATIRELFRNFSFFDLTTPNEAQRDFFYINMNGMDVFFDASDLLEHKYINTIEDKNYQFHTVILVICLICMGTTVVSSCFVVPALWKLDSEQEKIVQKWLVIDNNVKKKILSEIEHFVESFNENKQKVSPRKDHTRQSGVTRSQINKIPIQIEEELDKDQKKVTAFDSSYLY